MHSSEIARACAEIMRKSDATSRHIGIELVSADPGQAVVTMLVTDWMVNSLGTCHGGILFTLADVAFGYAANSHDELSTGQHCSIVYIAPASLGDRLVARAAERSRSGRSGIYDVTVSREEGPVVVEFRGLSRTLGKTVLPDRSGQPKELPGSR